jgi:nucleoside-diphosphate-sugar epimerase
MKVLVTGAFGNIGRSTVEEILSRGHDVRCFDLKTKANLREAKRIKQEAESVLGDLRNPEDVAIAVQDRDVVVHLGFVIPRLSATGVNSEDEPEWAREINVGGTQNLIHAMKAQPDPAKLLFASSFHIYGYTQDQAPPRKVTDIPHPVEHYAHHKVECERLVRESGLDWTIFRLAAALPVRLIFDPGMFDVGLDNRIEFVHTRDVGLAITNAMEIEEAWGRTWHIGGGPACQIYQRELVQEILEVVGLGMLPEEAFPSEPYPTDWLDTLESQQVLHYQRYTLQDYLQDLKSKLGFKRYFVRMFRPVIRAVLLSKSPLLAGRSS